MKKKNRFYRELWVANEEPYFKHKLQTTENIPRLGKFCSNVLPLSKELNFVIALEKKLLYVENVYLKYIIMLEYLIYTD